jgi:hypothetical protein
MISGFSGKLILLLRIEEWRGKRRESLVGKGFGY